MLSFPMFKEFAPYTPEEREVAMETYGLCVLHSLVSMTSTIAGRDIPLTQEETDYRLHQIEEGLKLINKRIAFPYLEAGPERDALESARLIQLAPSLAPASARMEKHAIVSLIEKYKTGNTVMSSILNASEIRFVSGTYADAVKFVQEGWQVTLDTCFQVGGEILFYQSHFLHLGLDPWGKLTDKSDFGFIKQGADFAIRSGRLAKNTDTKHQITGGWNILMIRPKS